jgi:hypothetical protein
MKIQEIFDTKAPIHWVRNDELHVGTFTYNGLSFAINIEIFFRSLNDGKTYTIVHVGFGLDDRSGNLLMDLSGLNKTDSMKIFGIVSNGIQEELNKYEIDIVVLGSTSKNVEERTSRLHIYDKLAKVFGKDRRIERNVSSSDGSYIILFRKDIDDNVVKSFIDSLQNS